MKPDLNKLLADEHFSLKKVLTIIQNNSLGTAFIISKNKELKGVITDGDIRRLILKNKLNLNENVKNFYNKKYKYLNINNGLEKINNSLYDSFKVINNADIDKIFVYGDKILNTFKYTKKIKQGSILKNKKDFDKIFPKLIKKDDYLMIKGSNATGLNKFSNIIIKGKRNAI